MDPQTTSTQSVREKLDIAWSHCTESKGRDGKKQFRCLHCGITYKGGGINRIKQHLAGIRGNIASCKKVPHDIRYQMQENLKEIGKKKQQAQEELEHNTAVFVDEYMEEERGSSSLPKSQSSDAHHEGTNKGKRKLDNIETFFAPRTRTGSQPSLKSVMASKEAIHRADLAAIDAIGAIGPGYKLPSYYKLRVNLLRDCKDECKLLIDSYKRSWSEIGCTLMDDGWTDNRNRTLINFLVYCPRGVAFLKSVDASDITKDAKTLCSLFCEVVQWIGPHNVVQLVIDNAANYKKAGELLHERFGNIYWSPCSAHCLNLILKDIGNMSHIQDLAQRASKVTIFVYNHIFVLAWLRKRDGWKEIIRPGATRFATTFITLKSMADHKLDLQAFITNSDEKPSLGFLYDGMYKARKAIKLMFRNAKRMYKPYTSIIKRRWDRQLRQGIHCAAYFLNPHFQYDKENFCQKAEVMQGLIELIGNKDICPKSTATMNEVRLFRDSLESFGKPIALTMAKEMQPDEEVLDDVGNDNEIIGNEDIDAFGGECFDEQGFRDITFDASNLGDDF
ncbi:hypothetical protein KFK09_001683 [Dendrobium nobile]|uniref:DUF659 domain-containing protein n=1 Tax=Dendrobium nobile TaxID=94219 RepID=A0A8T3C5H3_DENNO|nr:hypothetical protein KFK09_001683 [Dendrobium nobile]